MNILKYVKLVSVVFALSGLCSSCATPHERNQAAFVATGTVVPIVGFVVLAAASVALVPALDEAAVHVDESYPGMLRGNDAGPTCVAIKGKTLDGATTRQIICAEDPARISTHATRPTKRDVVAEVIAEAAARVAAGTP